MSQQSKNTKNNTNQLLIVFSPPLSVLLNGLLGIKINKSITWCSNMPGGSTQIPVPEGIHNHDHNISESVEELKIKLEAMKKLLAENQAKKDRENGSTTSSLTGEPTYRYHPPARYESLIDGNFLSVVFAVVFVLIVGVSFYAFQNLYFAVLKKFPSRHTEL